MPEPRQINKQLLIWTCVILGVAGVWLAVARFTEKPPSLNGISFSADANGNARVKGLSLENTNLRAAVFQALGAAGVKTVLTVPPSIQITNETQASNLMMTLDSMARAGVLRSNTKTNPNPYEKPTVTNLFLANFKLPL